MSENKLRGVAAVRGKNKLNLNSEIVLGSGVKVKIIPVQAFLTQEAASSIPMPKPPLWNNPDKGRTEPNPFDPDYLQAVEKAQEEQTQAIMDTIIMFGVQLVDPVPPTDGWLPQLRLMNKLGRISINSVLLDSQDPVELEFLYKRYMVITLEDMDVIAGLTNVRQEDIRAADANFQST